MSTSSDGGTATIVRVCSAPPARVFEAWITPADMKHWWTPDPTWPTGEITVDARKGGSFSCAFLPPGEPGFVEEGHYLEFEPPHRFVYTEHVLRAGKTVHGPAPCTVTFEGLEDNTPRLTVVSTLEPGEAPEARERGWATSLDLLVELFE